MKTPPHHELSRRERQIVDILYAQGRGTAAEVQAALPDPPSYSAVRAMLRILEEKGHVRHEQDGPRYVYVPTVARDNAKKSALRHVLRTSSTGPRNRPSRRCSTMRRRNCRTPSWTGLPG
jgi:predicted transcriptional regulator